MESITAKELKTLLSRLISFGMSKGITLATAEDLASESIRKALESYDPLRGTFAALAATAHSNLLKNYWRDRQNRPQDIDPEPDNYASSDDPVSVFENEDNMKYLMNELRSQLTPQETAFIETLGFLLIEKDDRIVSAAAERLGYNPEEGWNIFRRIRTKANKIQKRNDQPLFARRDISSYEDNELIISEAVCLAKSEYNAEPDLFEFARGFAVNQAYSRLVNSLSDIQRTTYNLSND